MADTFELDPVKYERFLQHYRNRKETTEAPMATESELLDRITVRADVFGGKPIVRDLRIAVEHILGMLAAGDTADTILKEYPVLEPDDIQACLLLAHRSLTGEHVHERVPVR